jgi:hypothetical protein
MVVPDVKERRAVVQINSPAWDRAAAARPGRRLRHRTRCAPQFVVAHVYGSEAHRHLQLDFAAGKRGVGFVGAGDAKRCRGVQNCSRIKTLVACRTGKSTELGEKLRRLRPLLG